MGQCCSVCTKLDINVNIILTLVDIESAFSVYFCLHFNVLTICFIIPPPNEVVGGVYWFHHVRLSVRPSVDKSHVVR